MVETEKDESYWKKRLRPEQFRILRGKGTEMPFTGALLYNKGNGTYVCGACGTPLFKSGAKFDSGTGWPSFDRAIMKNIKLREEGGLLMKQVEVACAKCGSHLGHVFDDGPTETGKRYCINSVALGFEEKKPGPDKGAGKTGRETATLGAGCFWHVEEEFRAMEGVLETAVGYMGGTATNPTYEDVCTNRTGHIEVAQVVFDPKKVSYGKLLEKFWAIHDPTSRDRQGLDFGSQYRSAIFYHNEKQKKAAEKAKKELGASGKYRSPIVTEIRKAGVFYRAEEYHQKYLAKHGRSSCPL